MAPRWYRKVWGSLHEPRTVTATMVAVYALLTTSAVLILTDRLAHDVATIFAASFMLIGGIVGMPSAWRGAWWSEGPAAMSALSGLVMLAIIDLQAAVDHARLPGYPLTLTLLVALFFVTRAMRIWPEMWAPGRGPMTPTREAQIRADTMVAMAEDAARAQRDRATD